MLAGIECIAIRNSFPSKPTPNRPTVTIRSLKSSSALHTNKPQKNNLALYASHHSPPPSTSFEAFSSIHVLLSCYIRRDAPFTHITSRMTQQSTVGRPTRATPHKPHRHTILRNVGRISFTGIDCHQILTPYPSRQ